MEDALGNRTEFEYDELGRQTRVVFPDGSDIEHQYTGLYRTATIDRAGRTTSFDYDAMGRLVSVTDAQNNTTSFEYDASGNRTAMVDANNNRSEWDYDAAHRNVEVRYPQVAAGVPTETFEYDARGLVTKHTTAQGVSIDYSYDELGRQVQVDYPSGRQVQYSYDADGNRLSRTDHLGTASWEYDALGRMVKSVDHAGRVIEYTYNSRGQMDTLTDPEGRVTEFDYDARGLPVQVTWDNQYVMSQQFDALGRLTEREMPNGVVTSHSYDELSQVQEITHEKSNQTVISSFDYEYDGAGNIVSITEADSAAFEYGYDETDQLVKEVRYDDLGDTVYGREYTYDPLGNRLVKEDLVTGDTTGYSYGADNRMLSAGDISFSYDIGGNMVEKDNNGDTVAYEWDEENNLAKVTLSDGTSMELTYDGDDIRASRTIDGEEVHFAWDPQSFNVVGEYDDLGNEDVAYGPQIGMDDPWVMERENNAYFYQTDHLNSVTELTDENEAVQNEYRYKAFGEALSAVEMVENEFQFTARRRDGVDGIQFNRFRHYQAEFGRWNQWDRIRYGDGPNMYGYVFNSPLNYSDRRGLFLGGVGKAVAKGVRRTWKLVKKGMHYGKGAALAPKDFIKNYMAMRSKNFIGADKFYHCVTHCEAAKRGAGGSDMAYMLGEIREYFDLYIKGDSISAVDADRDANRHGLNVCEDVACDEHCAKYMPEGFKP